MKRIILVLATVFAGATAHSQTTLPTSWDCSGATPNGWTLSGTTFYTGSGNPAPAIRFDNTGDFVDIWFTDDPGPLTYDLTGNSFSGGTFTILESVNGSSWTTLRTITTPPSGTYTAFTDNPQATTRYIRFEYTLKVSGNIGVDNITIAVAPASPNAEINIKQGTSSIINNGTAVIGSPVSTMSQLTLTIENLGTVNTLNIGSCTITGPQQSEFVISSAPATVSALSSQPLVIDFTPTASGTRNAVLTIPNDDSNENPYVINLYGVGGSFATEPAAQPTNLSFSSVKSYRYNVSFVATTADGYIVLRKKGSAVTDIPADGTVYTKGEGIGTSQVVYAGSATSFSPRDFIAGRTDHFAVFAYNGPGTYVNYRTTSPLTGNVTIPSQTMMNAGYYAGVSPSNSTFVSDLRGVINPHSTIFYSDYARTIMEGFYIRDTSNNQQVTTCVYSGLEYVFTPPFDFSVFSREHTIAASWMPSAGNTSTDEYTDYHNLFPTEFTNVNQVRLNYPLGEVVNVTSSYLNGTLGTNSQGQTVYEPRDQHKGDAARAMFYMNTSYHTLAGNWGFNNLLSTATNQDQNLLKMWHYMDPPGGFDMSHNDYLDSLQGNRNPFVDNPDWACYIDFDVMSWISTPSVPCNALNVNEENQPVDFIAYPNPASDVLNILMQSVTTSSVKVEVMDINGKIIKSENHPATNGLQVIAVNTSELSAGLYLVTLSTENYKISKKFSKE
ncbi:MAG: endonuclease [Bacteroidota bacterium]